MTRAAHMLRSELEHLIGEVELYHTDWDDFKASLDQVRRRAQELESDDEDRDQNTLIWTTEKDELDGSELLGYYSHPRLPLAEVIRKLRKVTGHAGKTPYTDGKSTACFFGQLGIGHGPFRAVFSLYDYKRGSDLHIGGFKRSRHGVPLDRLRELLTIEIDSVR
jgi:hypothetical protein